MKVEQPFKEGQRIELIRMGEDPCPVEPGTKGTVTRAVWLSGGGFWQVGVKWDNGRTLSLIVPPDQAKVISE